MESIFNNDKEKIDIDRIGFIDRYDEKRVRETLNLLLRDRKNEFSELPKPQASQDIQ